MGVEVLLVERERPGSRATGASAGMLAPQYEAEHADPLFLLALRSREMHGEFLARVESLADASVHHRCDGMLVPNFEPHEERRSGERAEWQRGRGLRAEVVPAAEAEELQPGLPPGVLSALWLPDEALVDTQRLAEVLPSALSRAGVRSVAAEATGILADGEAVAGVRLADGRELEAGAVVVAAGAWSGALEGLPRELPVEPVRGQMLRYPPGAASLRRLLANHGGRYLVPRADGSVLAGSTMEAAGFEASTTRAGERAIRNAAARLLPELRDVEPSGRWAGVRPGTPDGWPVLGPDPDLEGLLYATGYGRNGILLAPAGARIVTGLALEGSTELAWRPFRPERFGP
jgi:glycine oxidase